MANASLLDEATAAAEAMSMACNALRGKRSTFALLNDINQQTVNVVKTRAEPLDIKIENIRLLPGDYTVKVSKGLISEWNNTTLDLTYYIALEPN